ncbi:MAG: hypothetical protein ABIP48_06350 [Planctomycetota bacterium]
MARENQGLQIALIIFVMLTIILGVTTFIFFRQYEEAAAKAAEAQASASEAEGAASKIQGDFNTLKGYFGVAATENIEPIGEQFLAAMSTYAPTMPEADRDCLNVLKAQYGAIQAKDASLASELAARQKVQDDYEALEQIKAPLVVQQKKRADDRDADLAKARSDYNDARTALNQEKQSQLQLFTQRKQEDAVRAQGLETQIGDHVATIDKLTSLLGEANKEIIGIRKPTFEQADGKIRWVNQRNKTVWINLGQADALQRLTSFSVYPADTNDVTRVGKKASIEVTQVLGNHLAEARIVEDEPSDPILPGDVIHTPVWAPGEREHFALTDGMDIDGDGKSDLQMVLNIIRMNGGVVDCYVTDEGERVGDFTNDTRYLVIGDQPDETSTEARLNARKAILDDAARRAVMEIKLSALLDKMGWKNQAPVVRFGRDANPNDFKALPPEGGPKTSTGTVSPLFKSRTPPRSSNGTAY